MGTAQAVRRTSFGRLLLANLFGAAVVVCYLLASSPPERAIDGVGRDLAIVGLYLLVASCSGSILTGRMFRRALGWWDGRRAPSRLRRSVDSGVGPPGQGPQGQLKTLASCSPSNGTSFW